MQYSYNRYTTVLSFLFAVVCMGGGCGGGSKKQTSQEKSETVLRNELNNKSFVKKNTPSSPAVSQSGLKNENCVKKKNDPPPAVLQNGSCVKKRQILEKRLEAVFSSVKDGQIQALQDDLKDQINNNISITCDELQSLRQLFKSLISCNNKYIEGLRQICFYLPDQALEDLIGKLEKGSRPEDVIETLYKEAPESIKSNLESKKEEYIEEVEKTYKEFFLKEFEKIRLDEQLMKDLKDRLYKTNPNLKGRDLSEEEIKDLVCKESEDLLRRAFEVRERSRAS